MREGYKEIEPKWGCNVKEAVVLLWSHHADGERVYLDFNGVMLYSDTVTMEDAYQQVTGLPASQFFYDFK